MKPIPKIFTQIVRLIWIIVTISLAMVAQGLSGIAGGIEDYVGLVYLFLSLGLVCLSFYFFFSMINKFPLVKSYLKIIGALLSGITIILILID